MRVLIVGLAWGLCACGAEDPVLKAAREAAEAAPGVGSGSSGQGAPTQAGGHPIDGGMAMQPGAAGEVKEGIPNQPLVPGIPAEPEPGDPTSPSTGVPGEPVPGAPDGDAKKDEGPLAVIRGQIRMDDYRIGALRLDIFDGDHRSHVGQRPSLIRSIEILEPGSFEVKVPLSVGKVWLEASNDENQDGRPGPRDPVGRYRSNPLQLSASGNGGILIDLERNEPPPGGSGAEL